MWLSSLFARRHGRKPAPRKTAATRLSIEILEDRAVPSTSTAWGDFNNDGLTDRVQVFTSTNQVQVFLAQADGTYLAASPIKTASGPNDVVAGDFNNDGNLDALIATNVNTSLALGKGDGTFQKVTKVLDRSFINLAAGDVDNDGDLDFVGERREVLPSRGLPASRYHAAVYLNDGTGRFGLRSEFEIAYIVGSYSSGVLGNLVDVNGDGNLDLVATSGTTLLYGKGDGRFSYA